MGSEGTSVAGVSISGKNSFHTPKFGVKETDPVDETKITPYQQEHIDLIKSIRSGKLLNESQQVAESTLTAIMGRMSAYTGKEITWDQAIKSQLNLFPAKLELGPIATPAVAVPGKEQLV